MERETLTYEQEVKKLYFSDEPKFISKKKYVRGFKNPNGILASFSNSNYKNKMQDMKYILFVLKKVLLQSHYNFIVYAKYYKSKLILATANDTAQQELNYQKEFLIENLKHFDYFKDIQIVSVFKDYRFNIKKTRKRKPKNTNEDRSNGTFVNRINIQKKNKVLFETIEDIRSIIKQNN